MSGGTYVISLNLDKFMQVYNTKQSWLQARLGSNKSRVCNNNNITKKKTEKNLRFFYVEGGDCSSTNLVYVLDSFSLL